MTILERMVEADRIDINDMVHTINKLSARRGVKPNDKQVIHNALGSNVPWENTLELMMCYAKSILPDALDHPMDGTKIIKQQGGVR